MKKDEKLLSQILSALNAAIELSDFVYFWQEEPGYNVFSREVGAAQSWLSNVIDENEPKLAEKEYELFRLLENCAKMCADNGFEFLSADFERLARLIAPDPEPKIGSIGDGPHAVH